MENNLRDETFVLCALKGWTNIIKEENILLQERKRHQNSTFLFSEENTAKLKKINSLLQKWETEIQAHTERVRKTQMGWLKDNLIIDYEIDVKMQLWGSRYNGLHPDFEYDPFYECRLTHFGDKSEVKESVFLKDNWNEFRHSETHPLAKYFHCYTFHHLYEPTYLSWEDIVAIEDIWIDIEVQNQFLISIV